MDLDTTSLAFDLPDLPELEGILTQEELGVLMNDPTFSDGLDLSSLDPAQLQALTHQGRSSHTILHGEALEQATVVQTLSLVGERALATLHQNNL